MLVDKPVLPRAKWYACFLFFFNLIRFYLLRQNLKFFLGLINLKDKLLRVSLYFRAKRSDLRALTESYGPLFVDLVQISAGRRVSMVIDVDIRAWSRYFCNILRINFTSDTRIKCSFR